MYGGGRCYTVDRSLARANPFGLSPHERPSFSRLRHAKCREAQGNPVTIIIAL
jgi:hypothetical protein